MATGISLEPLVVEVPQGLATDCRGLPSASSSHNSCIPRTGQRSPNSDAFCLMSATQVAGARADVNERPTQSLRRPACVAGDGRAGGEGAERHQRDAIADAANVDAVQ